MRYPKLEIYRFHCLLAYFLTHTPLYSSSVYLSQHIEWSLTKHDSLRPPPMRVELTVSSRDPRTHSAHKTRGRREGHETASFYSSSKIQCVADSCAHWTLCESSNSHSLSDSRLPTIVTILCWKTTKMEWRSPIAVIFPRTNCNLHWKLIFNRLMADK